MSALAAARLGDEVAHGFGLLAMVAGAVAGAVIGTVIVGTVIVGAAVATGGAAVAIMAGAVAAGGLSLSQLVKGMTAMFDLPEPASGALMMGSPTVRINGRAAMRANLDFAACSGMPFNHPGLPAVPIAQGSASVRINGMPAARLKDKLMCGAHIKSGSPTVRIGGPTAQVRNIYDTEEWAESSLTALGIFAIGMGGGAAFAAARWAGLGIFAGVTGGIMLGFEGLGKLGDRLGPGGRDVLQGLAGVALLGLGPKLAKWGRAKTEVKPIEEPRNGSIQEPTNGTKQELPTEPLQKPIEELPKTPPENTPPNPVVKARATFGEHEFSDVNQTARQNPVVNKKTAISDVVEARELKTGKKLPNGNMATAHAEIGTMQQAVDAGVTKGADMIMDVSGKEVCNYCRSDVVSMAKAVELKSVTIFEEVSGKTLYWEQGMKKMGELK